MTFQSYMKPPTEKHNCSKWEPLKPLPSKKARQEAFMRYCVERGLTAKESMYLASVFSILPRDKIRIVHCPGF